jgi:hypothetical protein
MVRAILQNRQFQQAQTQESIANTIKQLQGQRSDAAYIQAAQNAGVLPQGDYSGMTAAQASNLAQRIQDMTPDTDVDNLHKAMAAYYNAGAQAGGRGSYRGSGRPGSMVTVTDDNGDPVLGADGNPVQVPAGSRLGQQIIAAQGNITADPSTSVAANIAAKMNLPPQSITDTATHQGMGLVPGSGVNARGEPYETKYMPVSPGDEPTDIKVSPSGIDPKTQLPYQPVIVQKDTLERLRKALQGSSYRPPSAGVRQSDVDQAAGAQGLTPPDLPPVVVTPNPTPPPSGTPPPGGAASGSGNVLVLRQQAQDAIANGKDPQAVRQKFRELTGGEL